MISLAWPLTYGELVTKRSLYFFAAFAATASTACGAAATVVLSSSSSETEMSTNRTESYFPNSTAIENTTSSCFDVFSTHEAFVLFQVKNIFKNINK